MSTLYTSTRRIWAAMVNRCTSPLDSRWKDYGGRNIFVCERWLVFENFVEDMGLRPDWHLVLDRRDNNRGYSKDNCQWVTYAENNENKRLYRRAKNNKTGVTGVSKGQYYNWRVFGGKTLLYQGNDFFEACCARKSWEARHR